MNTTTHEDWKAKQAARASMAQALQAANPHLIPISACGKGGALIAAAKNIRIELDRAFPAVKFSVKSRRFSMGDAIDVQWTDGPTSSQVDEIIKRYVSGTFDAMTDCAGNIDSAWMDAFGDARFVHGRRDHSDRAIASAIRYACTYWGVSEIPTVEQYRSGACRSIRQQNFGNYDLGDLIYQELSRRTWAIAKVHA